MKVRNYLLKNENQIKIQKYDPTGMSLDPVFKTIGHVLEINDELNICKVEFVDETGKNKSYWFHMFLGTVVNPPKKKDEYAKESGADSKRFYHLSNEEIYFFELYPNYVSPYLSKTNPTKETTTVNEVEEELPKTFVREIK